MGAVVSKVVTDIKGKVSINLDGKTKDGLATIFNAVLD
jgi:hypothetical protein